MKNKILTELPKITIEGGVEKVDWYKTVGTTIQCVYKDELYDIYILSKNKSILTVRYKENIKNINQHSLLSVKIGILVNNIKTDFVYNIGDIVNGLLITDRFREKSGNTRIRKYKYKCLKCGFNCGECFKNDQIRTNHSIAEYHLLSNCGCAVCSKQLVVTDINSIWKTNPWMIELGVDENWAKINTPNTNKKAPCKCPTCGLERMVLATSVFRNKTISCLCSDKISYPEKFMYSILKQLNIEFIYQYAPKYLSKKEFNSASQKLSDFYIPSKNIIIEMDGRLGHEFGVMHSRSNKTLEECIETDKWKDEQHALHGVKTIRINCFNSNMEYIKDNILNSELVNYFNTDKIDFFKCDKFSNFSNFKKEVCQYWKNKNKQETISDLSHIFKLSNTTIVKYLKIGDKYGWCEYNGDDEKSKRSVKIGMKNGFVINVYKKDEFIGAFRSMSEIDRCSLDLFGVKLKQSCISKYIKKNKEYKGFMFEIIGKYNEDVQLLN